MMHPTRRYFAVALAVSLLLPLAACNGGDGDGQRAVANSDDVAAATPPAEPAVPPVFDESFLKNQPVKFSQFREEAMLRYYFKDRRGGFFLDVGAAEPDVESTTHYLASVLGWKGIAIDARAELAPQYVKLRPDTKFFAYLVTDHSGATEKLYAAGRLSSGNADHLTQFGVDAKAKAVEVGSITLNDLLEREKVTKIDLLSMDIEGYEPPALSGFDIDKYSPELVLIEGAPKTRAAILEYFDKHGYQRITEFEKYDNPVNLYFEKKKGEAAKQPG